MEAHILVVAVQVLQVVDGLNALGLHNLVLDPGVKGADLHAEALGDASNVAANGAKGVDAQRLAQQLGARSAVVAVANHCHHHAQHQLGNSVGVLARSVHHAHTMSSSLGQVNVVVASTGADDNLQLLGSVKHFLVDLVAANNQTSGIGNGGNHVGLGAFLNQHELVASGLDNFLDALDCYRSKGFLSCN